MTQHTTINELLQHFPVQFQTQDPFKKNLFELLEKLEDVADFEKRTEWKNFNKNLRALIEDKRLTEPAWHLFHWKLAENKVIHLPDGYIINDLNLAGIKNLRYQISIEQYRNALIRGLNLPQHDSTFPKQLLLLQSQLKDKPLEKYSNDEIVLFYEWLVAVENYINEKKLALTDNQSYEIFKQDKDKLSAVISTPVRKKTLATMLIFYRKENGHYFESFDTLGIKNLKQFYNRIADEGPLTVHKHQELYRLVSQYLKTIKNSKNSITHQPDKLTNQIYLLLAWYLARANYDLSDSIPEFLQQEIGASQASFKELDFNQLIIVNVGNETFTFLANEVVGVSQNSEILKNPINNQQLPAKVAKKILANSFYFRTYSKAQLAEDKVNEALLQHYNLKFSAGFINMIQKMKQMLRDHGTTGKFGFNDTRASNALIEHFELLKTDYPDEFAMNSKIKLKTLNDNYQTFGEIFNFSENGSCVVSLSSYVDKWLESFQEFCKRHQGHSGYVATSTIKPRVQVDDDDNLNGRALTERFSLINC